MIDFDRPKLISVLRAAKLSEKSNPEYEMCLTGPSLNFTKFNPMSTDDAYADLPDIRATEFIPELTNSYLEELHLAINTVLCLRGNLTVVRWYVHTVPPVSVTPMRQSMGKTFIAIDLSRHNQSAWVLKDHCIFTGVNREAVEITPDGSFSIFNGSLKAPTIMLVIELDEK